MASRSPDDYAWLKDDNWQQVLRNPALLDADIRSYLRPRTATPRRFSGRRRRCRRRWSPRCAGASRRTILACRSRTGRSPISGSIAEGGQHELIGRTPRDGGDVRDHPRRRRAGQGVGLFQFRRHAAFARPSASKPGAPTCAARSISPSACDAGTAARTCPTSSSRPAAASSGVAISTFFFYVRARREPPAAAGLPPSAGHGAERRRPRLRGKGQRLVHAHRGERKRPLRVIATGNQETSERWLIDLSRAGRHAAPRWRRARHGVRYTRLRSRRRALHPHQRRRCDRLPHRHGAAGDARTRSHWRELIPHRPGIYIIGAGALRRPPGAAGAGERAALDRDPRPCRWRRACHRLRRSRPTRSTSSAATNSTPRPCASPTRR